MTAALRRRLTALMMAVGLVGWLALLTPPVAQAATPAADTTALATSFSSCAQQRGAADVILLLDQSLSLQETDPEQVRREASRALARELAEFAQTSGVDVRLQVAGFDGAYHANPWRELSPDALDPVNSEIDRMTSNDSGALGPATDYWMALDGARQQFTEAANERAACQLLLWFSDGEYDIDENGSFGNELPYAPGIPVNAANRDRIVAQGQKSICSTTSGPMTPMRATGVYVATVGLNVDSNNELDFMRKATLGTDGCALPPEPGHAAFLKADEAGALTLAIATMSGGEFSESGYQDRKATLPFGLDETVSRASVLAYPGPIEGQTTFGLSGPDGQTVWFDAAGGASQTVSGAQVTFTQIGQTGQFAIARPESLQGWKGTWNVHLQAAQDIAADVRAQMVVRVTGDLKPVWTNAVPEATIESGLDMDIALETAAKQPFKADHPGIQVSVTYLDQSGQSSTLKSGLTPADLRSPVHVDLPKNPGEGRLSVQLDLTTDTTPPTRVLPSVTAYDLLLRAAGDYPTVGRATFSTAAGVEPSDGVVTVTGPGCVWLDPAATTKAIVSRPDGVDQVTVAADAVSKHSCLTLASGEQKDFHVTLTPAAEGNGSIVGDLALNATPTGPGSQISMTVPFSADRTKAEKASTKWLTLIGVTLLGLALGSLPLLITRARMARIKVRDGLTGPLQVGRQRFTLTDGRVTDFTLTQADLAPAATGSADTVRRLDLDGVSIVPQAFGNPFTVPDCEVTSTSGQPLVTSRTTGKDTAAARLPLVLTGQWVAWPVGGDQFESLVFLTSAEALDSMLPNTSMQLAERIESSAAVLAAAARPEPVGVGAATEARDAGQPTGTGGAEWGEPAPWGTADTSGQSGPQSPPPAPERPTGKRPDAPADPGSGGGSAGTDDGSWGWGDPQDQRGPQQW